tara:strand:- start:452 stop:640 length:189 start_codon:yes stop_codon:yes gene_type:complete
LVLVVVQNQIVVLGVLVLTQFFQLLHPLVAEVVLMEVIQVIVKESLEVLAAEVEADLTLLVR